MKRSCFLTPFLVVLTAALGPATLCTTVRADAPATKPVATGQGMAFPYTILDQALEGKVDLSGGVDYLGLKGDKNLAAYVQAVAGADLSRFPVFLVKPDPDDPEHKNDKPYEDKSAELVFWINAYNAFVLKSISDAYPVDSPDEIKGFDTDKIHTLAGKQYGLKDMRVVIATLDGRGLFAITDGTRGGPMLSPKAYRYFDISQMLDRVVATYINDRRNVSVLREKNQVTVSDYLVETNAAFGTADKKKLPGVRRLLAGYTDVKGARNYLVAGDYQLVTTKRDRSLNQKEKAN